MLRWIDLFRLTAKLSQRDLQRAVVIYTKDGPRVVKSVCLAEDYDIPDLPRDCIILDIIHDECGSTNIGD